MIIDTHSHLQFNAYKDDVDAVIKRTQAKNIWCINVGTNYPSSKDGISFAKKHGEGFYAAIGLHPMYAGAEFLKIKNDNNESKELIEENTFDAQKYRELARSKKVVAIGEIGLDYYYKPKGTTKLAEFKEKQKQVFLQQLDLAKELGLPLIIHCRMAHDEMIEILESQNMRGVIHCFTGTLEQAKKYVELGFYLGINGIIFKFNIDEVIKNISLEHFLLETDCPYLTPPAAQMGDPAEPASLASRPQKRNEPIFMEYTIQKISELKGVTIEEVAQKTTENAKKLFGV